MTDPRAGAGGGGNGRGTAGRKGNGGRHLSLILNGRASNTSGRRTGRLGRAGQRRGWYGLCGLADSWDSWDQWDLWVPGIPLPNCGLLAVDPQGQTLGAAAGLQELVQHNFNRAIAP